MIRGERPTEAELLIARNRARHAIAALPDEPRIMPGLLLKRHDLEVLLAFTDCRAAEVEHRIAVMSAGRSPAGCDRLREIVKQVAAS